MYESLACLSLTSSSSADSPVQIISSGGYDEEEDGGDEDVEDDHLVPILGEQNKNIESETKQQKPKTEQIALNIAEIINAVHGVHCHQYVLT